MPTEREKNRQLTIELSLRGYEPMAVAKHLGMLPATVYRILKLGGFAEAARTAREEQAKQPTLPILPELKRSDADALRLVRQSIRTVGIGDVLDDLEDSGVHVNLIQSFLRWLRSPEAEFEGVNIGVASAVLGHKVVGKLLGLSPLEVRAAWTLAGEPAAIYSFKPEHPAWWLKYALRFGVYPAMDLFEERLNAGERQRALRASRKYKGKRLYEKYLKVDRGAPDADGGSGDEGTVGYDPTSDAGDGLPDPCEP